MNVYLSNNLITKTVSSFLSEYFPNIFHKNLLSQLKNQIQSKVYFVLQLW